MLTGMSLPAQPGPAPLGRLVTPHEHARPVPKDAPATPDVNFDATNLGEPVNLNKNWRVGITSNPAAANPDFDDSTWDVRDAKEMIADVPDEDHPAGAKTSDPDPDFRRDHPDHKRPFVWFRLHIKLAPNHGPVALLVELPVAHSTNIAIGAESPIADVYVNGKLIHPEGPNGDRPERFPPISRVYDLNIPPDQTSMLLVMRTFYIPFGYTAYTSFFARRTLHLGSPPDMNRQLELWSNHSLFERLPRLVVSILLVVLGLFLLALYWTQRGHREYLWLALHEFAQAPLSFIEVEGSSAHLDQLLYAALFFQLVAIAAYFYFEFLIAFLDLGRTWSPRLRFWFLKLPRYASPILAFVGPAFLIVGNHSTAAGIFLVFILLASVVWWIGWLIFCVVTLIAATARRNFEAGLLLFPLVLTFIGLLEPIFTTGMSDWTGHSYQSPLTVAAGPVPIHFASIADFAGLLAIVIIIFMRFLRIQRDRERASSELAAARSVQELMIPQERLETPGFEVDSIYNPANEVGGDFFHVEGTPEGGLLVVIGDVAGKGLKAAMNVSMLMGALRGTPERSPARILESLNRVLVDSDSFTTCQAAYFSPNGELLMANAGHLPPYLNTQEVPIPGGLPLGVLNEPSYDEVRLYLHPGDRLLLLSDGVVEARHASGELFGFDRVHNLSNQSAFYIADAAKAFGQEDDITVLTVRRMAAAVAA
jgi:uncharacterized membrane protein